MVKQFRQNTHAYGLWQIEEDPSFFAPQIAYIPPATHPGRQLQQLASRMVLESLHPGFPFDEVTVNGSGKPGFNHEHLHFSLSHCSGFAAGIVSEKGPVGIDVEVISDRVLKVENKFLNDQELEWLGKVDLPLRSTYSTLLWSIKETVFKYWGRSGVNFVEDIRISAITKLDQGVAKVSFRKQNAHPLEVQFLRYDQVWLSWMHTK